MTRDDSAEGVGRGGPEEPAKDDETVWRRVDGGIEDAAERFVGGFERAVDRSLPAHVRARLWARRRRTTHVLWRAGVLVVGFTLVLAGVAMLVLPGPGWAAIILGLIVLASEYAWARRVLQPVRRWAKQAASAAWDPRTRKRNLILGIGASVLMAAGLGWYVATYGFTWAPVLDLFSGGMGLVR